MDKRHIKKKLLFASPILFGIIVVLIFIGIRKSDAFEVGEKKIITSSTLMDAIDVSELSTAQFTYNGVAEIYKNEKKDVDCYIRYEAKVKAGINMEEVDFEIDEENKTVKPILPEIKINSNPIDEKSLSFIPDGKEIELKEVLTACKKDAKKEAMESQELMDRAEENLKSIIEALLYPILDSHGYIIIWEQD